MTGALFAVLVRSVTESPPPKFKGNPFAGSHDPGIDRVASMMFKGLDWLPPGDVTLADYARAEMLAADRFHHPDGRGADLPRRGVRATVDCQPP